MSFHENVGASKGGVSHDVISDMPTTTVVYSTMRQAAMTDVLNALGSVRGLWISTWCAHQRA